MVEKTLRKRVESDFKAPFGTNVKQKTNDRVISKVECSKNPSS